MVAIGNLDFRFSLIEKIESETNCKIATLISPNVYVAPSAKMEKGLIVEPMAVVHAMCRIGVGCVISAGIVVNRKCAW